MTLNELAKQVSEAFDDLDLIQEQIKNECISLPHTTYTIDGDTYSVAKHHNCKHHSGKTAGVYLQYDYNTAELLYIGKASGKSSGVGDRQTAHRSSYDFSIGSESSGQHMRNHMHERGINTLVMSAKYFDMTDAKPGFIEMVELALIDKLNPILNKERSR
jgi:hypothetical protein